MVFPVLFSFAIIHPRHGWEDEAHPPALCELWVAMASAPCRQSPWRCILMISVNKAGGDDQCVRPPPVQGAHSQLPHHCRLPGSGLQLCQRLCNIKILMDQLETASKKTHKGVLDTYCLFAWRRGGLGRGGGGAEVVI